MNDLECLSLFGCIVHTLTHACRLAPLPITTLTVTEHTLTHAPLSLQALADADAAQKQGDDKGWRRNFVRAMNHVALKRAQAAAARAHAGDDDGASVVALSEGGASNVTK